LLAAPCPRIASSSAATSTSQAHSAVDYLASNAAASGLNADRLRRMRSTLVLAAMALASIPSMAAAKPPVIAYFDMPSEDVVSRLARACVDREVMVTQQSTTTVQCEQEVSGFKGMLAQVLIGNSYSTTPNQVIRFSISKSETFTIVQASAWMETQMAFGQVRRAPLDSKKNRRGIFDYLRSAGGTSYPQPRPKRAPLVEAGAEPQGEPAESVAQPSATQHQETIPKPTPKIAPQKKSRVQCTTCGL